MNKRYVILTLVMLLSSLLFACSDNALLKDYLDELNLPEEITSDIELKTEDTYKNKTIVIEWYSSNEECLETSGVVHPTLLDESVTLIATAKLDNLQAKKVFYVTVKNDQAPEILKKVANSYVFPETLSTNLNLPSSKTIQGETVSITWSSSNPDVMSNTGKVTPGETDELIVLEGTFRLRKAEIKKEYTVKVMHSESYNPENMWYKAAVYTGKIQNEITPDPVSAFAGAIYYKVQSSKDYWLGIETVVTLPEFIGDEGRTGVNPWGSEMDIRYLDNASVYLGGNCFSESDVGLTWSIGSRDALNTGVDYSKSVAFRPFWRYLDKGVNTYQNAGWTNTEYYYYPGDTVRMSVFSVREGYLKLRIELLEETTITKYAQKRASYNLGENYSKVFLSPEFPSGGVGRYKTLFKHVNALDQANNEGKPTQPTNAQSVKTIWRECYLYREIDGVVYKVPMSPERTCSAGVPSSTNSLGDFTNAFKISYEGVNRALGGEIVTISPNNRK